MWTDLLYLTGCTVLLKALVCVPVNGAYRLDVEKAQLCFTLDHMPVFLVSLLLYLGLFLYPFAVFFLLKSSIDCKLAAGERLEQSAMYSATVFMIQSVKLEWKPHRASYRFLLRNTIAVLGVVPDEFSSVLLGVASVSVLDCVFILVKRPYENIAFDLWNFVKGLGLALVIIFNLPDVKSRLFPKGDGTLTGEEVRAHTHAPSVCIRAYACVAALRARVCGCASV